MKLPRSLSNWARQLSIFPDEISFALGSLARKISPFFNALRSANEISDREPNGYDGVARRGIYERLLLSELALADEVPEEFVRRAVMGEHLFLNLARVAPSAKRFSAALFDAGPAQLGTPRIAHLAVLIVLARRAEAANAAFLWGVLQDRETTVLSEVTVSNITNLLKSRTAEPVKNAHLKLWREKFRELESIDDVWLVGSENLQAFEEVKGFSILTVEDVTEPAARQLQITVNSANGEKKQTTLELPDDAICTRLLRNPFEIYDSPEMINANAKTGNFFFDENGGKLFTRAGEKKILYVPVSNMPDNDTRKPRQFAVRRENSILLAAGRLGKSVAFITLEAEGHLHLDYPVSAQFQLPEGNYLVENDELILPKNADALMPVYNLHYPNSPFYQAAFLDGANNLFTLTKNDKLGNVYAGRASLAAGKIVAAARTERRFVFVGKSKIISYGEKTERRDLQFSEIKSAFFGRGHKIADPVFGLLAVGDHDNHFVVIKNGDDKHIDATEKSEVVGVYYDPSFSAEIGLLELDENRRALSLNVGRKYGKQIFASGEEIEKIVFSHRSPVCAYRTISGKIVIFSLTRRVPIGEIETS